MLRVQIISLHSRSKNSFHPAWERTALPSLISLKPLLSGLRSGGLRSAPWTGRVRPSLLSLSLPLAASLSHTRIYSSFCLPHSPQHLASQALCLPVISPSSLPLFPGQAACKQEVVKREKKKKGCGLENLRSSGRFPCHRSQALSAVWTPPGDSRGTASRTLQQPS